MHAASREEADAPAAAIGPGGKAFDEALAAIAAGASERDLRRDPPFDAIALLRAARIGSLRLRREHGGGGASVRQLFEAVIAIAAADSNVAHILRNHFAFVERYVRPARNAIPPSWRERVAAGKLFGLGSTELTQAKAGRADDLQTRLVKTGSGYVLNGTKYYSTGNMYCDFVPVRAQAEDGRLATVLVEARQQGVELIDDWDGMGQRLTGSGTSRFTDVAIAAAEVLFDDQGLQHIRQYNSTFPQVYLTVVNVGILQAIVRDAAALVRGRGRSFYHAPTARAAEDPILHQVIGQISAYAFAARQTVLAVADALEAANEAHEAGLPSDELARDASLAAARAKVVVDEWVIKAGSMIFDVGGASATKKAANLDMHWRNARTLASHNPASYKAAAIGNYVVNDIAPPNGSFF